MALLNAFKNPKANILYGAGNSKISDAEIKNFINAPGRTDAEIEGAALKYGVSVDQIARAGKGNARFAKPNMEKYLTEQGITKDLADVPMAQPVAMPKTVTPTPITVGTNETVQGRMDGLLKDQHNPLNVQAQTFGAQQANKRGLLNSSIGISAAQDAMYKNAMPIASQDAGTFYDAKKTNSGQDLQAGMFNADLESKVGMFNSDQNARVGMFNAGQAKDIMLAREGNDLTRHMANETNDLNRFMANLDADNRMAIANIEAMSKDSGIMGDLGKSYMGLYQQTASDPNIAPEVKTQIFNQLKSQFESISSLLPSFEKAGKQLTFGTTGNAGAADSSSSTGGADTGKKSEVTTLPPKINDAIGKINVLGYQPEPYTLAKVANYERVTGTKVDRNLVVPEQLKEDLNIFYAGGFNEAYTSGDGNPKRRNFGAYDLFGLMKMVGVGSVNELQNLFVPVHPPGTMRADGPMFYMWNQDLLNKVK